MLGYDTMQGQPTLRSVRELDHLSTVLADIEIVNVVDELLNTGNVLDMSSINTKHNTLSVKISSVKSDEIFEKFCHF